MRALEIYQQSSTAAVTFSNTALPQNIVPITTIQPFALLMGRRIRLRAWGVFSSAITPPSVVFTLQTGGGNRNANAPYTLPASATDWSWEYEADAMNDSITSGGTMLLRAQVKIQIMATGETITLQMPRQSQPAHNGLATSIRAVFAFSTANAANSLTVQSSSVDVF
jgi:hypothetical protein